MLKIVSIEDFLYIARNIDLSSAFLTKIAEDTLFLSSGRVAMFTGIKPCKGIFVAESGQEYSYVKKHYNLTKPSIQDIFAEGGRLWTREEFEQKSGSFISVYKKIGLASN